MTGTAISLKALDGTKLSATLFGASKISRFGVLIVDDLGGSGTKNRLLVSLAKSLAGHDLHTMIQDHRGHNQSEGSQSKLTIRTMHMDLDIGLHHLLSLGCKRVGILSLGLSAASGTILASVRRDQIFALAVWYPVVDFQTLFVRPSTPKASEWVSHLKANLDESSSVEYFNTGFQMGYDFYQDMQLIYPHLEAPKIQRDVVYIYGENDSYTSANQHRHQLSFYKKGHAKCMPSAGYGFKGRDATEASDITGAYLTKILSNQ